MIKQELSLNLATSFPCFSVLSHDLKCCSENESLWSSMHHNSTMSAYPHYTMIDTKVAQQTLTATTTNNNADITPPNYDEAIKKFSHY
ncbi:hypothetical protein ACH3XW_47310 [Acanthocheilonema viteae]